MLATLLIIFFAGLAIGIPVALVMGMSTLSAFLFDSMIPLEIFPQRLFSGIDSFPMLTIPFFVLAADLMSGGRLTDMIIKFANDLIGHIRGGLGHVNVLVSMMFAGISGSALADAAGPGAVEMKMMHKAGYSPYYAGALSAASSVIGNIIPPSIIMVIFALASGNTSVNGLFLAGVIPGILIGLLLMVANHVISVRNNYQVKSKRTPLREVGKSFLQAFPSLLMPLIILGGILTGIFTATEAGAVAVAYSIIVGVFITKALKWKDIPKIIIQSGIVTSSLLLLISMGSAFSWILTYAQIPQQVAGWITGLTDSPLIALFLVALISLLTGMFVDTIPAVIILTPVLTPVAAQFGAEPLQVGMIIIVTIAIGMLTPPVAPLLFVTSTVGKLKFEKLSKAVIPLLLVELGIVVLLILIPELSTWLPNLFGYKN
jgi:tripartite ATP-independent transporter DctM subunit